MSGLSGEKVCKIFKNCSVITLCRQKQDQHSPRAKSNPIFHPEIWTDHRLSRTFHLIKIYALTELWMISYLVDILLPKIAILKSFKCNFLLCFPSGSSLIVTVKKFLHLNFWTTETTNRLHKVIIISVW